MSRTVRNPVYKRKTKKRRDKAPRRNYEDMS